jgi:hypothetical protein
MNGARKPPAWGKPLNEDDYLRLAQSWITRELADLAMLRRVDSIEGCEVIGQKRKRDCAGLLIPYYWPGEPSPFNYRVRRDNPEWEEGKNGQLKQIRKYLGPPGGANRLYIPPGVTLEQLRDTALPIVIVEGEKKALALWRLANHETDSPRFIPIAIAGVWNWRGKVGKASGPRGERVDVHGPIGDLSRIEWNGRTVLIVFDADVRTNDGVHWARKGIAKVLAIRGAKVRLINLPQDSGVNGVDELLVAWGPDRVLKLFDQPDADPPNEYDLDQAQILIALADEAKLFHTADGEAYAQVPVDHHRETWTLRSRGFKRWIVLKYYQKCGKPPGSQQLQNAIGLLEAKAQYGSPEAPLFVRFAELEGRIYVDLCDVNWRVVEIGPRGWRVIADAPVHFRHARGMHALPKPAGGGSITLLRNLINIGDDNNWILCISWLTAACRPKGPFPILILQGEQGSAKSTTVKLLRKIIDPSSALVRTPPRDGRDLLIAATNSWVIAYDNLSGLPVWLSDSFCRLSTGGGFSTRELYTDGDEVFFDAMRPVVLNGIDHLAERADLADRSLILNLPPIPSENRRDEAQLYADFERRLPQILGAFFTGVSVALARLGQITLDSKPRMADFALWATAAEPAFGFPQGAFMKAYGGNRAEAVHETLEGDPVGVAILGFMEKQEFWEGTCKQLLQQLEQHVEEATKKSREWPKSPRGLSSRLRRLVTFLRELRIQIKFHSRGTNGQRTITLSRPEAHSTATTVTTDIGGPAGSADQSVTPEEASGGSGSKVTDDASAAEQPPLGPADATSLEVRDQETGVAVVTVVTVNCCIRCGPVEWIWVDGAWICPNCKEPAPKKAPRSSLQIIHKRRLANDGE